MMSTNRRRFLQQTAAGASLFTIAGTRASDRILGANNRLRVAVVGCNSRGKGHIDGWLKQENAELAYVVDPDSRVLERTLASIKRRVKGKMTTQGEADVRRVLEDPNLDAVSVATPNHWHSLITIWAAQAGKHVYVEKPMSHDVEEGRICVEAQQKYGIVIQHGTQRRSSASIAGLTEAVQSGKYGRLKISYGYCCKPRGGIGFKTGGTPPSNLDWNIWRGPAQIDQFHGNYAHYNWHWFWKTGNGDLNNQGTHQLDVARWALDKELTHPTRVMALGGRFQWNDQGETPNTMFGIGEFPNGQYCFFNVRNVGYDGYERQVENEYYFEDGGRIVRGQYFAKGSAKGEKVSYDPGQVTPGGNWGAFATACREGKPELVNGNVYDAHYGCVLGHLMNNSYRLGKKVPFNRKAGRFGDNADAAEHFGRLHDIMANGVGLPEDGNDYVVGPWLEFNPKTERHIGNHAKEANALLKDPNHKGFEIPGRGQV